MQDILSFKQIAAKAYEQSQISLQSVIIANEIEKILPLLKMYETENTSIITLVKSMDILRGLHFRHSFSGFEKEHYKQLNSNQP